MTKIRSHIPFIKKKKKKKKTAMKSEVKASLCCLKLSMLTWCSSLRQADLLQHFNILGQFSWIIIVNKYVYS